MDYAAYREAYFVDPPPEPRFAHGGVFGVALFFEQYAEAVDFYSRVLGPPGYVEGDNTRGWRIGGSAPGSGVQRESEDLHELSPGP